MDGRRRAPSSISFLMSLDRPAWESGRVVEHDVLDLLAGPSPSAANAAVFLLRNAERRGPAPVRGDDDCPTLSLRVWRRWAQQTPVLAMSAMPDGPPRRWPLDLFMMFLLLFETADAAVCRGPSCAVPTCGNDGRGQAHALRPSRRRAAWAGRWGRGCPRRGRAMSAVRGALPSGSASAALARGVDRGGPAPRPEARRATAWRNRRACPRMPREIGVGPRAMRGPP